MKTWRPGRRMSWAHIGDTIYVVDEKTDEMYYFREDAIKLWECIEQRLSADEIAARIARPEHFEEDRATIIGTLDDLKECGIIEEEEVC